MASFVHRAPGLDSEATSTLTRMQQRVLSWDYFTLGTEEEASHAAQLRQLPKTFANFQEYIEAFEPLILEECTAQILRGEEGIVRDPHISIVTACDRVGPFHVVRFGLESGMARLYKDNDLILVSKLPPKEDVDEAHAQAHVHALGVIETHEGATSLRVRFFLPESATLGSVATRRQANEGRFRAVRSELAVANSPWWLLHLCNLSTIQREWLALHQAANLPFKDVICAAEDKASRLRMTWRIPGPLAASLKASYNASQVEAIQAGLDTQPIVLIQGPPGTGKTATLLALLSVIMHAVPTTFSHGRSLQDANAQMASEHTPRPSATERRALWERASPWMGQEGNPRDILPEDHERLGALGPAAAKPEVLGQSVQRGAHVLVCAPSNSALDEIVLRLMTIGLKDASGAAYKPSVVRVGLNPHRSVEGVFLDKLVEQRLASTQDARKRRRAGDAGGAGGTGTGLERDRARLAILDDAAIVACTLSFSGSGLLSRTTRQFDVVVIDEAAQAVEPSTLVPLAYGCKQIFLVGDPVQLPATVLSETARNLGYETSMFARFQSAIREFPSREFYAEALQDGEGMAEKTQRPWHSHPALGPLTFFNVEGVQYHPEGTNSWANDDEAEIILLLVRLLLRYSDALVQGGGLAVVSPYKAQCANIRGKLREALGEALSEQIDVNTIDGFQGREKDVVIFSVVRAPAQGKSIGFVADERRTNVGLTRARASLVVIGSARALRTDEHWGNLVTHSKDRGRFVTAFKPYGTFVEGLEKADPSALHLSGGPEPEDYGHGGEGEGEGEFVPQAEDRVAIGNGEMSGDEGAEETAPSREQKGTTFRKKRKAPTSDGGGGKRKPAGGGGGEGGGAAAAADKEGQGAGAAAKKAKKKAGS